MDLQEQLEIGRQAEDFLKYVSEHPYFEGLIERIKLEYARQILDTAALDKDVFSRLKWQMDAVAGITYAVSGDIAMGSEALKQLDGVKDTGGLL